MQGALNTIPFNLSCTEGIPSKKAALRVLLWGGYGGGNVGDYLTLDQGIYTIQQQYPDAVIHILDTVNPKLTQSLFPAIAVVGLLGPGHANTPLCRLPYRLQTAYCRLSLLPLIPEMTKAFIIRQLQQTDLLYCVGGGYFNDLYRAGFYLNPVEWAKQLGVTIKTAPVGLGPFHSSRTLRRFIKAFHGQQLIVRDAQSADLVKPHLSPTVTADDGYAWARRQQSINPVSPTKAGGKLRIAVCAMASRECHDPQAFSVWWQQCCRQLSTRFDIEWMPFSFDYRPHFEAQLMQSIWPDIPVVMPSDTHFYDPIRVIQQADLVLTGRFHATVIANSFNKPCIAVYSNPYYRSKLTPLAIPQQCVAKHYTDLPLDQLSQTIGDLVKTTHCLI